MTINDQSSISPTPSFELSDIYYTLFRHKWKIVICSMLGFAVAAALYKLIPPPYISEARLFIRYVVTEGKSPGLPRDDAITKSPDQRGETILNSELEILTSLDLAQQVARNIGPEKILAKAGGGNDANAAAGMIRSGLLVDVPRGSSVIRISFQHPDAAVVQPVLQDLIDSYLKKHLEIHRAIGMVGDLITQETDDLRARLAQTEEELRKATSKAGIISLEDARKTFAEQISRIRQEIFDAQADLAERSAILQSSTTVSNGTPGTESDLPAPPEQVLNYQKICARLAFMQKAEQDYLLNFSEESTRVKAIRALMAVAEEQKKKLETDFPSLGKLPIAKLASGNPAGNQTDPSTQAIQINALQAKVKVLNSQLAEVRAEAAHVDEMATSILELRRRKDLEETNYHYYATKLEESRINEALGAGRVSNITPIQNPSPPARDWSKRLKFLMAAAGGGIALGLGWAFLIELFLDRSIRRPADIERTLGLPLFLSIPKIKSGALPGRTNTPQLLAPKSEENESGLITAPVANGSELALRPFHETLRDRLISYFDTLNVRHKPKLVAVTGLSSDAGVTTLAAGLARSFSETGEGNVLLVDMTQGQGSAQHFHKGATVVGLEQLLHTRDSAQVKDHLYVVSENSNSERLAKGMPQRFNQLIPKLKASDFDYIIFDMPTVNQISITPRLASFMDMMLMVIESEKTDRDVALHASALLAKSKAPVGVVLNKTKSYIPPSLHQDREFLLGT